MILSVSCGKKEEENEEKSIEITDTFALSIPDMDFNQIYQLETDEISSILSEYKALYGVNVSKIAYVVFTLDDEAVYMYEIYVLSSKDEARDFAGLLGKEMNLKENIAYISYDKEDILRNICEITELSDSSASNYIEYLKNKYMLNGE